MHTLKPVQTDGIPVDKVYHEQSIERDGEHFYLVMRSTPDHPTRVAGRMMVSDRITREEALAYVRAGVLSDLLSLLDGGR